MKKYLLIVSLIAILICAVSLLFLKEIPYAGAQVYDILHENKFVSNYSETKKILSNYKKVTELGIPINLQKRYSYKFEGYFYVIPVSDVQKKICLHNRINSFLSKEDQTDSYYFTDQGYKYLYLNEKLMISFFDLVYKLQSVGLNTSEIVVNSAVRSDLHNDRVGGAPKSMHLQGKALDLRIGDINSDGKKDAKDKDIVYKILDKEIITNKGGLGFYPGTMIIHMDVRGNRARWDHYHRSM